MPLPLALVLLYHNVTIFYQKLQDPKPYKMTRKYGFGFGGFYHIMEIYAFVRRGTSMAVTASRKKSFQLDGIATRFILGKADATQ